jgi:hypothetical protein
MSSLVVALLSFAIALVIGALLSKAFFATQSPAKDVMRRNHRRKTSSLATSITLY